MIVVPGLRSPCRSASERRSRRWRGRVWRRRRGVQEQPTVVGHQPVGAGVPEVEADGDVQADATVDRQPPGGVEELPHHRLCSLPAGRPTISTSPVRSTPTSVAPQRPGTRKICSRRIRSGRRAWSRSTAPSGSRPSRARTSSSGAPDAHACGTARGRVLGREAGLRPDEPRERLRAAGCREVRRLEQPHRDLGGLGPVPVLRQRQHRERRVVRPDRPEVVADRVVAGLAGGEGADRPSRCRAGRPIRSSTTRSTLSSSTIPLQSR